MFKPILTVALLATLATATLPVVPTLVNAEEEVAAAQSYIQANSSTSRQENYASIFNKGSVDTFKSLIQTDIEYILTADAKVLYTEILAYLEGMTGNTKAAEWAMIIRDMFSVQMASFGGNIGDIETSAGPINNTSNEDTNNDTLENSTEVSGNQL